MTIVINGVHVIADLDHLEIDIHVDPKGEEIGPSRIRVYDGRLTIKAGLHTNAAVTIEGINGGSLVLDGYGRVAGEPT